jgi:hypothetical protein
VRQEEEEEMELERGVEEGELVFVCQPPATAPPQDTIPLGRGLYNLILLPPGGGGGEKRHLGEKYEKEEKRKERKKKKREMEETRLFLSHK